MLLRLTPHLCETDLRPGAAYLDVRKTASRYNTKLLIAGRSGMTRAAGGGRRGAAAAAVAAADVPAVLSLLDRYTHLPSMGVLDLDYTLWPFWCEFFQPNDTPWLYPEVPAILSALQQRGIPMALASRTPTPHVASSFIDQLGIRDKFCSIQLIPAANGHDSVSASKDKAHFPAIQRETGCAYTDCLFFDDESGNIKKVSRLGVVSILVDTQTGVCLHSLKRGLDAFAATK